MTLGFWEQQTQRALELAGTVDGATELLVFYNQLLRAQGQVYQHCMTSRWDLSGQLERDLKTLRPAFATILWAAESAGPQRLVEEVRRLKSSAPEEIDRLLLSYWKEPSDAEFFAKAFLQPYAHCIAATSPHLMNATAASSERRCPFCGGQPQLSVLQNREAGAESGNRDLMCAKCLSTWPFRRAVCAHCGEETPAKLAYFQSDAFNHVRVEACDTCKHYLKGIDLTRLGNAEPLVDEIAAASLDLWATEHGYTKIERNLVGL